MKEEAMERVPAPVHIRIRSERTALRSGSRESMMARQKVSANAGEEGMELLQVEAEGSITRLPDGFLIHYRDQDADGEWAEHTIRVRDSVPEILIGQNGPVSCAMRFREGEQRDAHYRTPYGTVPFETRTQAVEILREKEHLRRIGLRYELILAGEADAGFSVKIDVE